MSALLLAIQALQSLLTLLPLGQQVATEYQTVVAKLQALQASGSDPSQSDWDALDAAVAALEAQLQASRA